MFKVKFLYKGMLFNSWHIIPMTFNSRPEAERMCKIILADYTSKIADVKIEKL